MASHATHPEPAEAPRHAEAPPPDAPRRAGEPGPGQDRTRRPTRPTTPTTGHDARTKPTNAGSPRSAARGLSPACQAASAARVAPRDPGRDFV